MGEREALDAFAERVMLTLAGKPLAVPVLQGGMGVGVSLGGLAGAVAACGGMGCISTADTGYREPDFCPRPFAQPNLRALKKEIAKAKEIAGGAGLVAINAMVATQNYADAVRTAVEAGVDAIVSGAGLPLELPGLVEKRDVALAPIVSSGRRKAHPPPVGKSLQPHRRLRSHRGLGPAGTWAFRKKSFWPENARPSTRSCPKCWPR